MIIPDYSVTVDGIDIISLISILNNDKATSINFLVSCRRAGLLISNHVYI